MPGRYGIEAGYAVYTSDGQKLGTVRGFTDAYCEVEADAQILGRCRYYIPLNMFRDVHGREAFLYVPSDRIDQTGWDRKPASRPSNALGGPAGSDRLHG